MKIYSGDINSLRKQIEMHFDYIHKNKNKVETLELISNIEVLLSTEEYMNQNRSNYWKRLKSCRNLVVEQIVKTNRLNDKYIDEFIKYKNFHYNFITDLFEKIDYEVLDDAILKEDVEDIEEYKMYTSISDFLVKNKDDELLNSFNNLIDKKQIYELYLKDYKYSGIHLNSTINKEHYIFINRYYDSFEQMTNLVHELGHIKDNEELLKFQSKKNLIYYNFKSAMSEVISSFYEVKFLSFLLDSGLYKERSTTSLVDYDYFILSQLGLVKILSSLDDDILRHENYKELDKETFYNILINKENDGYDDIIEDYDIFDNVNYGYGRLIALYFSHLEKSDKEKFLDVYQKFNINKFDYFNPSFFSKIGIREDDIITGVNQELKDQSTKILKRKY